MQTNLLQSQLHRNAIIITSLIKAMLEAKADAKGAQLAASRKHHRSVVVSLSKKINRLAEIQKAIKFDLHAMKLARLVRDQHGDVVPGARLVHGVAVQRKKHGTNDQRYIDWLAANGRNGGPAFGLPNVQEGIGIAQAA
jgi:hypothetical protein